MKIKKNMIETFIKKLYLDGLNYKAIFDFKEDGLSIQLKNDNSTIAMYLFLDKKHFKDYEAIGSLVVGNIDKLVFSLNMMKSEWIEIKHIENMNNIEYLLFQDSNERKYYKMLSMDISAEKFEILEKMNNIQFDEELEFETDIFDEAEQYKNKLNETSYIINIENDILKISVGSRNSDKIELKSTLSKKLENKYRMVLGVYFSKVIGVLKSKSILKMSVDTNIPIIIENNDDDVYVKYVVSQEDDTED